MRIAAWLLALVTILVGLVGIVSPDTVMTIRRSYYTPEGLLAGGAVRVAMGLVVIMAASGSRWPGTLRAVGALMCMQGIAANLLGLERARAILEWEAMHTALLRAGALVALVSGGLIAFAVKEGPSEERRKVAH